MKTNTKINTLLVLLSVTVNCLSADNEINKVKSLNTSEEMVKEFLDSFKQSGIPTPSAIEAVFQKAKESPSLESWDAAAKMANSFANTVDVLATHYSSLHNSSRTSHPPDGYTAHLRTAAAHERVRNKYLDMRNAAYIELAKIYLKEGDKSKALSLAITAIKLSGSSPNLKGEQLIRKIIEYTENDDREAKLDGTKFLAENDKRKGVKTTTSGLQYEVIKAADGAKPVPTDKVTIHYHGTLVNGKVFDSSIERGEPITIGVQEVIKGWTEGLQLMSIGSKFKFFIPSDLAYGDQGAGADIGPSETIIFEVELLKIEK